MIGYLPNILRCAEDLVESYGDHALFLNDYAKARETLGLAAALQQALERQGLWLHFVGKLAA